MAETTPAPNNITVKFGGKPEREANMAKLDTAERKALPKKDFAGPGRSYPVENKSHAVNAKARATQMLKKGQLSKAEHGKIIAKANAVLKKSGAKTDDDSGEDDNGME